MVGSPGGEGPGEREGSLAVGGGGFQAALSWASWGDILFPKRWMMAGRRQEMVMGSSGESLKSTITETLPALSPLLKMEE